MADGSWLASTEAIRANHITLLRRYHTHPACTPPPGPSKLLALPAEMRLEIFRHYIAGIQKRHRIINNTHAVELLFTSEGEIRCRQPAPQAALLDLLLVNKQVSREVIDTFFELQEIAVRVTNSHRPIGHRYTVADGGAFLERSRHARLQVDLHGGTRQDCCAGILGHDWRMLEQAIAALGGRSPPAKIKVELDSRHLVASDRQSYLDSLAKLTQKCVAVDGLDSTSSTQALTVYSELSKQLRGADLPNFHCRCTWILVRYHGRSCQSTHCIAKPRMPYA